MLRGVRGATTIEQNSETVILSATEELLAKMIEVNGIEPEAVASVFISATDDVNAVFPAKALRRFPGWTYVPVMCMQELHVPNSLEYCVRVMMHVNTDKTQKEIVHVYLKDAQSLRPDLNEPSL
ncbi:chorismate mutase [Neobacillus sp. SM06]|uniref:chorismate mutase n=1 Tax=Neobacillus sp. SM06 TaxID=3422492 RepID=UPI003D288A4D